MARALARHAADRFATAGEFAVALQAAESGSGSAAPAATTPVATTPVATAPVQARRRAARTAMVVGGIVAIGVGAVVLGRSRARGPDAAASAAPPASAAVLPFTDLSPAHDQEYFSDGLTEELITALSRIEGLRVAARTSSFQYKGRQVDVREIGRQLDVGSVLEGSVRRSGNRVRISAQLVSARDGYQLWADEYDRELADVFAVQDDIARAITGALKVRLVAGSAVPAGRPTEDTEAPDLYLKGRFAWNQRTAAGMREAVRYLGQAVARDPKYARAQAALADAYVLLIPYSGAPRAETWAKAQAAAAKALALDSTLAEAHTALAYGTMIYDWDWPRAEASFRLAIAADSTYPTAHQWYGDFSGAAAGSRRRSTRCSAPTGSTRCRGLSPATWLGGSRRRAATTRRSGRRARRSSCTRAPPRRTGDSACVYAVKHLPREAIAACERAAALGRAG